MSVSKKFRLLIIVSSILSVLVVGTIYHPNKIQITPKLPNNLHPSPTRNLQPDAHAHVSGYCTTGTGYIHWNFTSSDTIHVWALEDTEYWKWINQGWGSGYLLSAGSGSSGDFTPPHSDIWYIVFWNDNWDYPVTVTYQVSFHSEPFRSITITEPNSSSSYATGSTHTIRWTSTGSIGDVSIGFSKEGSFPTFLTWSTPDDGEFIWTVPLSCLSGTDYRITVKDTDDLVSDVNYFTIIAPNRTLTITQPNSTTVLIADTSTYSHPLSWNSTGYIPNIKAELFKGPNLISIIDPNLDNDGHELWKAPFGLTTGSDYRIKITDITNNSTYGYSDYFIILASGSKSLNITNPTLYSTYEAGTTQSMTWDSSGPIKDIEVQLFKGDTLNATIHSSIFNDREESWTVPKHCKTGTDYRLKIVDKSNSSIYDYSEYFTIKTQRTLRVIRPNSSSSWWTNSSHNITWESTGEIASVRIVLFEGNTRIIGIIPSTPNDGTYLWKIPLTIPSGSNYNIKIVDTSDSNIVNFSKAFTINTTKSILINFPSAQSSVDRGTTPEIKWTSTGEIHYVKIELYYNTDYVSTITSNTSNSGSFYWSVPFDSHIGNNFRVKITDIMDANMFNYSGYFSIEFKKVLSLVFPKSDTIYTLGSIANITWVTNSSYETVKIELYYNLNGSLEFYYLICSTTTNNGSYLWEIPSSIIPMNVYLIKISTNDGFTIGWSEVFTISEFKSQNIPGYSVILILSAIGVIFAVIIKKKRVHFSKVR